MEISVEELDYCKLYVKCQSSKDELQAKTAEVLEAFKKAPVPGNRKNKASLSAIKFHYRNQINESVKRAMAESCFHETLFEKAIKPLGMPEFKSMTLGQDAFTCEFMLNKKPEFELSKYKDLEVPEAQVEHTAESIAQRLIEELRVKCGSSTAFSATDVVELGDNVILDYECFDGDVKVETVAAKGELVGVGKTQLVGFDDNLVGMKAGETKSFEFYMPDDGRSIISGKTVKFVVSLVSGSKLAPAALDDELAKRLNLENVQQLLDQANAVGSKQLQDLKNSKKVEQITAQLLDFNKFEVPQWLSLQEAKYLTSANNINWDSLSEDDKAPYMSMGEKNVKLALILEKIREEEPECQLTDEEVLAMIRKNLSSMTLEKSVEDTLVELNKNGYLQVVANRARDEHTLTFVISKAKILE